MKSVLISIKPKWCKLIANGKKTVEIRKTKPKLKTPFKVYIYCTKGEPAFTQSAFCDEVSNGKVIGEFVCKRIDTIAKRGVDNNFDYCYLSLNTFGNDDIEIEITNIKKSCISKEELNSYGDNSPCLYAWHISDLVIYDQPRKLNEFVSTSIVNTNCFGQHLHKLDKPPQSWCYVEGGKK